MASARPSVALIAFFANTAVDRIVPNQERREGTQVRLHYVDYAGATSHDWISIVMMTPSTISAVLESTGEQNIVGDTLEPLRLGPYSYGNVSLVLRLNRFPK